MEAKFNLISLIIIILTTKFYDVKGDCENINPPHNSWISGSCVAPNTTTGAVCEILCKNSCRLENSQNNRLTIRCVNNVWSPDKIGCVTTQQCDSNIPMIAGRTYNCLNYFNLGSICSFSCLPGFSAASGLRNAISCMANDSINECRKPIWNPPINEIITCNQNRCPDLTLINVQTYGVCTGAVQSQQCTLTCPTGTYLNLNRAQQLNITCVGSQWNPSITQPLQCISITCPNLQPPANGSFTVGSNCSPGIAGLTCSFQCNAGFVLNANITLTCQSNSNWSLGVVPICIRPPPPIMCPELPRTITNGGIRNLNGCSPPVPGSRCEYSCDSVNYYLVGDREKFCQISNGQWIPSNTPPNCTRTLCTAKRPIPNGRQTGDCNPGISGSVCSYVCNATYGLIGTTDFLCQPTNMSVGVWQPSSLPGLPEILPSCAQIYCPSIKSWNNSQNVVTYSGNCETSIPGSICNIRCTTGYFYSILCQANGVWNETQIKCNATICPYLPYPDNGFNYGVCQGNVAVGQVCNFACNDTNSYILLPKESARVTCTAVGWSNYITNNPPQCVRYTPCPNISEPENSNLNGTCAPGKPGETCEFICDDGYELSGSEVDSMTCHLNGSWIPDTPPSCVEQQCSDVAVNPHVIMSGSCSPGIVNKDCSFSCPPGYTLTGNNKITCGSDLTWSGEPPECTIKTIKQCQPLKLPSPKNRYRKICAQRKVNTKCDIFCAQGYGLLSKLPKKTLKCRNNGQWDGMVPQCLRQCTKLRNTNGRLSGQYCGPTGLERKSCSVSCNSGFRLVGPRTVTCGETGYWSPSLPRCLRNNIGIIIVRRFG